MKILITGATGFVGSALCKMLIQDKHQVIALVRDPLTAKKKLPNVELIPWKHYSKEFETAHEHFDAVINLMGENIAGGRWSQSRKKSIYESRVEGTRFLFKFLEGKKIDTFIQASAVGIYGNTDKKTHEASAVADDFLASVCKDWEKVARDNSEQYKRLCIFRFGLVLGKGGILEKMTAGFKTGLAGKLGDGQQFMSWIHIEDLLKMIEKALGDESWVGIFNAVSEKPVTNEEFTITLGEALDRPTFLTAPGFVLKLALGEMSQLLLEGQKVVPASAIKKGYHFKFNDLESALKDILT